MKIFTSIAKGYGLILRGGGANIKYRLDLNNNPLWTTDLFNHHI